MRFSAALRVGLSTLHWLCGFAVLFLSLAPGRAQYDPDWTYNFRAGAIAGFNIKASFKTGSTLAISGNNPGATNTPGVNHFFEDGYVRVDDFGNSGGYTTYWGYQNSSQVDAPNNRLLYHGASSFASANGGSSSGNSQAADVGFELAAGGYPWRWEHLRLGFDFGFGYLPINISGKESLQGNLAHSTFSFQIPNGVVIPGPPPYDGPRSGSGQTLILDNMSQVNSSNSAGTLTGTQTLDVTLYSLRLGPSLYWDLSRYFGLSVSAGPAVGFVTGNLLFDETITVSGVPVRNKGSIGSTEFVYGGYVNAMLTYHATQGGDLFLGVQFMPLSNANFSGGGRSARLDLHGAVSISGGINWPF